MGNKLSDGNLNKTSIIKNKEYQLGTKLLKAIEADSPDRIEECIHFAKSEIKPDLHRTADDDFKTLNNNIMQYLTQGYNTGDGVMFLKTPLEYAKSIGAKKAYKKIQEEINNLSRYTNNKVIVTHEIDKKDGKVKENCETIDKERVQLAKERLIAMRNKRRPS